MASNFALCISSELHVRGQPEKGRPAMESATSREKELKSLTHLININHITINRKELFLFLCGFFLFKGVIFYGKRNFCKS
jgi:hypothetical protein